MVPLCQYSHLQKCKYCYFLVNNLKLTSLVGTSCYFSKVSIIVSLHLQVEHLALSTASFRNKKFVEQTLKRKDT